MEPLHPMHIESTGTARRPAWRIAGWCAVLIGLAFATTSAPVLAQSPLSSGEGKGSVLLQEGAFIQFELADKAAKASYQHEFGGYVTRRYRTRPDRRIRFVPRLGASLRAAVDNNRGSIFSKDELAVGGEVVLNGGVSNLITYRQSKNEEEHNVTLGNLLDDIVKNQGQGYPSLEMLHDSLVNAAARLKAAQKRAPTDNDESLRAAVGDSAKADSVAVQAREALNQGFGRTGSEADRVALRTRYEQALIALTAARVRLEQLTKGRGDSLNEALKAFETQRADYVSMHPGFAAAIQQRYPLPRRALADSFPGIVEPPKPETETSKAQPRALTLEETFLLDYILNGVPDDLDENETKVRNQNIALVRRYLTRLGPGGAFFDQLDLRIGISRNQYKILAPDAEFASQVRTERPISFSALLSYSIEYEGRAGGGGWPRVLGIAVGGEQRTNAGTLSSVDLRDVVFSSKDSTGTTIRTGESVQKVLRGTYERYEAFVASTDFIVYPPLFDNRVAVNGFTRYATGGGGVAGGLTPGVGVLLVEEGAPRKVIGGVSLFWENGKKARANLVVGFNF